MDESNLSKLMPGQLLARGVCRHLLSYDFVSVEELVPTPGRRVDVMALGPKGEIWIVECKSSRADFQSDHKWQDYLQWCDRYFWAVDQEFPSEILPDDTGLIIADAYDAAILRMGQSIGWHPRGAKSSSKNLPAMPHAELRPVVTPAWRVLAGRPEGHRAYFATAAAARAAAIISSAISLASSISKSIGISASPAVTKILTMP